MNCLPGRISRSLAKFANWSGVETDTCRIDFEENIGRARFYLAANPLIDSNRVAAAHKLQAIIELYGAFPDTVDYSACFSRGIEVLSTGPGMRNSVAEMAIAMALAGAWGLVQEHENFRRGTENWFSDNDATDFSLYGADVGFVGFGQIARECTRLLAPFAPNVTAYDPWVDPELAKDYGVRLVSLDEVARSSRCLFVTAAPTRSNRGCRRHDDREAAASRSGGRGKPRSRR